MDAGSDKVVPPDTCQSFTVIVANSLVLRRTGKRKRTSLIAQVNPLQLLVCTQEIFRMDMSSPESF